MRAERANPLPGIRFLAEPAALAAALPRMDVAAFVGFAARGPLHVPVAVEDAAQFRDVFGEDLPLAWDGEARRLQRSLLGPSVELFFRNGGRRCWVLRVAAPGREGAGAQTQSYRVPGLYRLDALLSPARARARAPGAWADALRAGARLIARPLETLGLAIGPAAPRYRLQVRAGAVTPQVGDLLELRMDAAGLRLYLFVDALNLETGVLELQAATGEWFEPLPALGSPPASPPLPEPPPGALLPLGEALGLGSWGAWASPAPPVQARLLRMELLAWRGDRLEGQLGELGFDPRHRRYWAALPDDEALYRRLLELGDGALGEELSALWSEARSPRFALAGPGGSARYLPLDMSVRRDPAQALAGDLALAGTGLGAEGLAALSADLFLDPDLAALRTATLPGEARHKRLVRGAPLTGIHALLPLAEVSLIGMPDAAHRHWDRRPRPADPPLPAPWLDPVGPRDARGRRALTWSAVDGARHYLLEQSDSPEFALPRRDRVDPPDALELMDPASLPVPENGLLVSLEEDCPAERYFRVRAVGYGEQSAWSNTQVLRLPEGGFRGCARADIESLGLRLTLGPGSVPGNRRFAWTALSPAGLDARVEGFELERASELDFLTRVPVYQGPDAEVELALPADLRSYYRVRALTPGGPGPWSNTLIVDPLVLASDSLVPVEEYADADLLALHCALLRLCAARGDCLGALGLPMHYRAQAVAGHLDALAPATAGVESFGTGALRVPGLSLEEAVALTHGALFHPWLRHAQSRAGSREVEAAPPEGVALGAIAARSIERGAWISPANEPLFEVLGLTPALAEAAALDLLAHPVNLLRAGPRGVLLAKADTLGALDPLGRYAELAALSVRRFMHMLRRLVEREGARYVFEPNGPDFHDAVRAQWQQLLLDLYARGALRGAQPERAFRVFVDPLGEAARLPDLGRLVVELHVAPAQPLRFLQVRLIQAGPEGLVVQEV